MKSVKRMQIIGVIVCQFWGIHAVYPDELNLSIPYAAIPPEIDARLGDAAWRSAAKVDLAGVDQAVQNESLYTQALIMYDDTALYVAFLNRDPEPSNLVADISVQDHDSHVPGDDSGPRENLPG